MSWTSSGSNTAAGHTITAGRPSPSSSSSRMSPAPPPRPVCKEEEAALQGHCTSASPLLAATAAGGAPPLPTPGVRVEGTSSALPPKPKGEGSGMRAACLTSHRTAFDAASAAACSLTALSPSTPPHSRFATAHAAVRAVVRTLCRISCNMSGRQRGAARRSAAMPPPSAARLPKAHAACSASMLELPESARTRQGEDERWIEEERPDEPSLPAQRASRAAASTRAASSPPSSAAQTALSSSPKGPCGECTARTRRARSASADGLPAGLLRLPGAAPPAPAQPGGERPCGTARGASGLARQLSVRTTTLVKPCGSCNARRFVSNASLAFTTRSAESAKSSCWGARSPSPSFFGARRFDIPADYCSDPPSQGVSLQSPLHICLQRSHGALRGRARTCRDVRRTRRR
jgi:hypothetical protein